MKWGYLIAVLLTVASAPVLAQRRVSEEALLFRQVRGGVVTVSGDEGSGSGFLVDSTGIILTNDHVVGNSIRIRVKLNDSIRVQARLLASNPTKDIAAIQIAPHLVSGLPVLKLAQPSDTMVFEGEKVIAIGSPLNQEKIMTAGIVSKVEPTAIISDVNVNHGNSGGPLINMNGEVVAINAFGDFTSKGGPGVSGSILITEARAIWAKAQESASSAPPPSDSLLPVPSRIPFPLDTLQVVASMKKFDSKPYDVSDRVDTGKFEVVVVTPIFDTWRTHEYEQRRAEYVRKREKKGGTSKSESYDPTREMREWMRYTGDDYKAVVTIQMTPKYGETGGSVFGNILGAMASGMAGTGYRGRHKYEFKADFKDVVVLRNGVEVPDVLRGKQFIPLEFARSTWSADYWGEDFARAGVFQCSPDWFAPDSSEAPEIEVRISSVERPDKPYRFILPEKTVKRIWADFAPHRSMTGAPMPSLPDGLKTVVAGQGGTAAPASADPIVPGVPVTIGLKSGDLVPARRIEPYGLDTYRVTLTSGEEKYFDANKIETVMSEDGTDWTKKVIEERKRVP